MQSGLRLYMDSNTCVTNGNVSYAKYWNLSSTGSTGIKYLYYKFIDWMVSDLNLH